MPVVSNQGPVIYLYRLDDNHYNYVITTKEHHYLDFVLKKFDSSIVPLADQVRLLDVLTVRAASP